MVQTKVQDKTPQRGLNEMEIINLLEDFKVTVIKMLTDLQNSTGTLREDFNNYKI